MQNTLSTSATESVEKSNIIFGPIHSRRFGVSLGIDLSPSHKQCNFDCLYCELAPAATTNAQTQPLSVESIITELYKHLDEKVDVVTLTANGEPTLYPYLSELIDEINKIKNSTKTLILTNSATLTEPKVFDALLKLDQVKLSLDALSNDVFKKIDRPHEKIDVELIAKKVIEFSKVFKGELFIEILFVHTLNDTLQEVSKLNALLLQLKNLSRIDLGTIDRPPAYPVVGVSYGKLRELSLMFDSSLPINIASRTHAEPNNTSFTKEQIINTLDKRPLTHEDIELLFDEASQQRLKELCDDGKVMLKKSANLAFYLPTQNLKRKKDKN